MEASEIANSLIQLVQRRREPNKILESVRLLSEYLLSNTLVIQALLPSLAWLRANKKAGEENKAIGAIYQALAASAAGGSIESGVVAAVQRALEADVSDAVPTRQLAALRLYAELAVLYPSIPGALPREATAAGSGRGPRRPTATSTADAVSREGPARRPRSASA